MGQFKKSDLSFLPREGRFDFINWFVLPRRTGNRLLGGKKGVERCVLDESLTHVLLPWQRILSPALMLFLGRTCTVGLQSVHEDTGARACARTHTHSEFRIFELLYSPQCRTFVILRQVWTDHTFFFFSGRFFFDLSILSKCDLA